MKKTFRFLSMAALLVVGAIMTGCSSDDNIDNPQQPKNNDNVVTLTATVSLDGGAGTRAVDGTTGAKTFESGKQIAVFYEDASGNLQKAVSTDFTPLTDATKATFTVTLSTPKSGGKIRYIYPASMAKALDATPTAYPAAATIDDVTIDYSGIFGSQNGTLTTLANYDLAVKDATLSGTDQPATVTLTNPLAICKFTLKDEGSNDITNDVTSLTISDATNAYAVSPSGLSEIYVAMKPTSGNIAFTARTSDSKTYFKTATGTSLVASKLYTNITVGSMVELALGKVFCSDGSVLADARNATVGQTPVAKIAYLGNDAENSPTNTAFKNGLALALEDVYGVKTWCSQTSATCLGTQYTGGTRFNDLAGIDNTDALVNHTGHTHAAASAARGYDYGNHPAGTSVWFLPSAGQWDKMATAAGSYANLKTKAGLQVSALYWSSTETYTYVAWNFFANDGRWRNSLKDSDAHVRSCLAF